LALIEAAGPFIAGQEGISSYMYPDTSVPRVVTCGIGHALFTSSAARELRWLRATDGRPAYADEIDKAWSGVRYGGQRDTALYLAQEDIQTLFERDLNNVTPALYASFPAFHSYPEPAQVALTDMAFNLGSFRPSIWKLFIPAVLDRNWPVAGEQCARKRVSAARNEATRQLFLEAASAA
jgi:GH24 family phage-related lysozyme (muramidase)